jgi:cysteine desulfurase
MTLRETAIYMDNHATTRLDPRVLESMLPYFTETYGNAASTTHAFGWQARDAVEAAREKIAAAIGATSREIVFTSGATESNNLAICGVAERARQKGKHLISVCTEHPSVLDPLDRLARRGFEVALVPVIQTPDSRAGLIVLDQLAASLRSDTILVSVMLANNEIGAIQSVAEIARICRASGVLVHTDATQAVGKIPVDVNELHVDLMSFTAHKIYGPKGIGALYVRRRTPPIRIEPLIYGGGHERGLRSGTLNVPGIIGFARAIELAIHEMPEESIRLRTLRDRLYEGLTAAVPRTALNGPDLEPAGLRLPGNLNMSFAGVDGEAILLNLKEVVALSAGSACTSATPEPSHVLRALGIGDEAVRGSLRFGLGRFNTPEEVEHVIGGLAEVVPRLRKMAAS